MNRYMSYQYSNNNFSYATPTISSAPSASSGRINRPDSNMTTMYTSKTGVASAGSQYDTPTSYRFRSTALQANARSQGSDTSEASRYGANKLPWFSSLASSSRYPSTATTKSSQVGPRGRLHQELSTTQNFNRHHDKSTAALSSTISGRSLFDYSGPRTAINTPASRIYDGQLRRTVTAKFNRTLADQPSSSGISPPSASSSEVTATGFPVESEASDGAKGTRRSNETTAIDADKIANQCADNTTKPQATAAETSKSSSKPFRSHSLKLRASYTNILDQLTSTTLAKLRLGGGGHESTANSLSSTPHNSLQSSLFGGRNNSTRHHVNNHATGSSLANAKPVLDVVPDEPELEETFTTSGSKDQSPNHPDYHQDHSRTITNERLCHLETPLNLLTSTKSNNDVCSMTTVSPNSSSSGLSSSGIACGSSGAGGCASSTSHSSTSLVQTTSSANTNPKHMSNYSGPSNGAANKIKNIDDSGRSDDDDDEGQVCGGVACRQSNRSLRRSSRASSRDQDTLVSPVDRRLIYLDRELGIDKNNLVHRDNIAKTGAILAELERFEDSSDQIEPSASLDSERTDEKSKLPPTKELVNESELILKPKQAAEKPAISGTSNIASTSNRHKEHASGGGSNKANTSKAGEQLKLLSDVGLIVTNEIRRDESEDGEELANYADVEDYHEADEVISEAADNDGAEPYDNLVSFWSPIERFAGPKLA